MNTLSPSPLSPAPARKRARVDEDVDTNHWERHPDLYMTDGTLAIVANKTVFRAYSGLLARHSEVFSNMASFADRQPLDAEVYDGCPLVRVPDDPDDFAWFLEATMGRNFFHPSKPTSYRIAAGLLRLSTKYMVTPLRLQAIEHFERIIPKGFDEIRKKDSFKDVFGDDVPHPFQLVALFRENQLVRFLPWTYYAACAEGIRKLVSGATHNGKVVQLSNEDTRVAVLGWKCLRDDALKTRRTVIKSRASNCRLGACDDTLRMVWMDTVFHDIQSDAVDQWKTMKILASYDHIEPGSLSPELVNIAPCHPCATAWLAKEKERRVQIWRDLPKVFGLPPWDELEQE